jgi:hypothetical protein
MTDILELLDSWPGVGSGKHSELTLRHHEWIKSLASAVKILKMDLDLHKEIVRKQQERIDELDRQTKEKNAPVFTYASVVSRNQKKTETDVALLAKVQSEMEEKKKIEKNIIVSGLPESFGEDAEEVKENEDALVSELLAELKIPNDSYKRYVRIKKKTAQTQSNDKSSLLLIEFNNYNLQATALANASLLRDNPKFEKIYVNPDKTFAERVIEAQRRKERNELNKQLPYVSNNGIHRYGIENGKRFYYGIRHGRIVPLVPKQSN